MKSKNTTTTGLLILALILSARRTDQPDPDPALRSRQSIRSRPYFRCQPGDHLEAYQKIWD